MIAINAPDFNLHATLASGQAFRWRRQDEAWVGYVGRGVWALRQTGDRLIGRASDPAVTAEAVARYFALDLDYPAILSSINVDLQVHGAIRRHRGLRILRQDGWEVLASFICATFNNIRRIEGMIDRLCQAYGDPVALDGVRGFAFPAPQALAAAPERHLRALGLGYRAPYLRATARLVADGRLPVEQLRRADYETVRRALLACDGVGEKVADCVALFGIEKYEAFPVDVWMARVMRYYFRHRRVTPAALHDYARRHFGPYAGYAQQYLYHDIRSQRASGRGSTPVAAGAP